ncbi:MAG: hypothetical protein RI883_404 [Bacteroidota bacterium]|jgi:hypothetical protein
MIESILATRIARLFISDKKRFYCIFFLIAQYNLIHDKIAFIDIELNALHL